MVTSLPPAEPPIATAIAVWMVAQGVACTVQSFPESCPPLATYSVTDVSAEAAWLAATDEANAPPNTSNPARAVRHPRWNPRCWPLPVVTCSETRPIPYPLDPLVASPAVAAHLPNGISKESNLHFWECGRHAQAHIQAWGASLARPRGVVMVRPSIWVIQPRMQVKCEHGTRRCSVGDALHQPQGGGSV